MPQLTKQEILFELARRDIRYFVKATQPDYVFARFNLQILNALSKFYADVLAEKRPILIIEAPPQHGKSELASRKFPAFLFGLNPNLRLLGVERYAKGYKEDYANATAGVMVKQPIGIVRRVGI